MDAIGIVLLVAGWAILDVAAWRRRGTLSLGRGALLALVVVAFVGAALVPWSVLRDRGAWWVLGAAVLSAIQLGAAIAVTLRERGATDS